MDIFSLPDEMLASVLKYSTFKDLTKIRKLSSKVDSVAKRHHLDAVRMNSLTFSSNEGFVDVRLDYSGVATSHQQFKADNFLDMLKYYFQRIRNLKRLCIYFNHSEICISNEVAKLLLGQTCRYLTVLHMRQVHLPLSFELMRSILTKLKLNDLYISLKRSEFELSDKLIDGLALDSLVLVNRQKGTTISLSGLENLCAKRLPSELFFDRINLTVLELGQFFEKYIVHPLPTEIRWTLSINRCEMGKNEILPYFSGLKCFKAMKVSYSSNVKRMTLNIFNEVNPMEKLNMRITIRIY